MAKKGDHMLGKLEKQVKRKSKDGGAEMSRAARSTTHRHGAIINESKLIANPPTFKNVMRG
jgi:hypothetical protein